MRQPGFALESNPAALGATVVILALLLYAAGDIVINSETYAADRPLEWFVTGGVLALAIGFPALLRFRVPSAEALALALLLGGAAGAALYPGLLRVNQLTDTAGPRAYEYRMRDFGIWEPVHAGPPTMTFEGHEEYWEQFRRGERREFTLRRGALGFYQIDMARVGAEIRAFRERNRPKSPLTAWVFPPSPPPASSAATR